MFRFWKTFTQLYYVFFIDPTIKWIIITFPFNIYFFAFPLDYVFNSKLFLICFLQLFFLKSYSVFFPLRIFLINNISNHKTFFRPIWSVTSCKNIFIFWYSDNIITFKLRIFIINFFTRGNICVWFYINRFSFNCIRICIVVFIYYIIYFISINSILEMVFFTPVKLLSNHLASCSLRNFTFLILYTAHSEKRIILSFLVLTIFEFLFSVFFLHFKQ